MKNNWLGYFSSALLLFAGVLMITADKLLLGCLFIGLSLAGLLLRIYMGKKQKEDS